MCALFVFPKANKSQKPTVTIDLCDLEDSRLFNTLSINDTVE